MFGNGASDSGDLFDSTPSQKATVVAAPTPNKPQDAVSSRRKLKPAKRVARFNELLDFVSYRIGLKPVAKTPEQVRNSAWGHLFDLATTRDQLKQVTELFPRWRDSRREFNEKTAQRFIGEWFGFDMTTHVQRLDKDGAMSLSVRTSPWMCSAIIRNTASRSLPLLSRVT